MGMKDKAYFVVPGFQKAGTTYLHTMLIQHPDIYLTKSKELEYFSRDFGKSAYENYFNQIGSEVYYGDISPQYLYTPGTAKNIRKYRHDTKIIILIRDPIERFISHARMGERRCEIESLDSLLRESDLTIKETDYYKYTLYQTMIIEYIDQFPLEQILFVESDLLLKNPEKALYEIENFLQVSHFKYKGIGAEVHKGGSVRFRQISSLINFMIGLLKPYKSFIASFVSLRNVSKILFLIETKWNVKRENQTTLSEENYRKLLRIFKSQYKYIESLKKEKGCNFVFRG